MAKQLTPGTLDLDVWGSASLVTLFPKLDKGLYSTLSLLTRAQLLKDRLALNPGFFFLCSKAFSPIIFFFSFLLFLGLPITDL